MRMFFAIISHIIAKIPALFFLPVGRRVTVGVVIGVADLILPDKNIGEVGRQLAQHFQR